MTLPADFAAMSSRFHFGFYDVVEALVDVFGHGTLFGPGENVTKIQEPPLLFAIRSNGQFAGSGKSSDYYCKTSNDCGKKNRAERTGQNLRWLAHNRASSVKLIMIELKFEAKLYPAGICRLITLKGCFLSWDSRRALLPATSQLWSTTCNVYGSSNFGHLFRHNCVNPQVHIL